MLVHNMQGVNRVLTKYYHTSMIVRMKPGWVDELAEILVEIRSKKDMIEFLRGLLTEGELAEVATRVQIVKKLKAGISQHAIAKDMGVGVATVTRGSKEIQKGRFIQV
jgi:TrpR family transcriptional regulator, trp operon repressor